MKFEGGRIPTDSYLDGFAVVSDIVAFLGQCFAWSSQGVS